MLGVSLSHLGAPTGPMICVHGGFANRMYRLDNDQGSFAVKELHLTDHRWTYPVEDVFRFERAAFAAGIPMPEPISAGNLTLVHRWVEGEKVPEAPVSPAYAFEIGEILARVHALDVDWTHVSIEERTSRDWPELAERAAATGQRGPTNSPPTSRRSSRLLISSTPANGQAHNADPQGHPTVDLLAREGRPVVLDWELSGMLDLSGELGSTALILAKGPGFDDIEPAIFRSVVDGYVAGRGDTAAVES